MTAPVVRTDDEAVAAIARLAERMQCFIDDMRTKGIHVGFGSPARCVCCGELSPCPDSTGGAT